MNAEEYASSMNLKPWAKSISMNIKIMYIKKANCITQRVIPAAVNIF